MDAISPSDLKTILHSKRANIYYLEHCRVLVKGGRVEYVTEQDKTSLYWNIPIANTTSILLGTGTSITQAAMRELAKAGVLVGFCGGGGTPLYSANEVDIAAVWFSPQSEYRPTEYLQKWVKLWFNEQHRLQAAKQLQLLRLQRILDNWLSNSRLKKAGFVIDAIDLQPLITNYNKSIEASVNTDELLLLEARLSKALFRLAAQTVQYGKFTRIKQGLGVDPANRFLDHGNYLAYGLAATATWVLGLPHGLAILHGKTRRGGLVFDSADLVKDAVILPQAFIAAMQGDDAQTFRQTCINELTQTQALDFIIDSLKQLANVTASQVLENR